jgi:hypothetical protein
MKHENHPEHDSLIDFVEGNLPSAATHEIEAHVAGCEVCRAYVTSLQQTFSALEMDRVPEPPEAFFAYLAGRARARASRSRRRLAFRFVPGLAAAAAAVVLMWWLAGTSLSPVDSVDIIMADMTTGQIVETVSFDPDAGSLLVEDSGDRLKEIEAYILETESIYDLLDSMSESEKERFTAYIEGSMTGDGGTSGLMTDSMRKEC